ncbi:MAG: hypothetical protein ACO1RX_08220 [Candidatus Sericytochromatia bacterium]
MVDYVASWTSRDIYFGAYDPNCSVLVSPFLVNKVWTTDQWVRMPQNLFVDSGAFQYMNWPTWPDPSKVLEGQMNILGTTIHPSLVCLCSPDIPLKGKNLSPRERLQRVSKSIKRAEIYFALLKNMPEYRSMGVIQAYDAESAFYSAQSLAEIGYREFGIGSLAALPVSNQISRFVEIVESVHAAIPYPVHLFGVTSPSALERIDTTRICSIDSSSPAREAFNGTVLYAQPFRRYQVNINARSFERMRNYAFTEILEQALPCNCPVCQKDPTRLFWEGIKEKIKWRVLHNYYQLKWQITGVFPTYEN